MDTSTVWWILVGVGGFALGGYAGMHDWEAGDRYGACAKFYLGCTFVLFVYGITITVGWSWWILLLAILYVLPIGIFELIFPPEK